MFAIIELRGDRCTLNLTLCDQEAREAISCASLVWDPRPPEEYLLEGGFEPKLTRRLFRAVKACRESLA